MTTEQADAALRIRQRQRAIGLLCGLISAVGYTLANMALRQSARPGDFDWSIWVTAHKAIPATLMTWVMIYRNYARGEPAFPSRRAILPLIWAGLIMQFGGNLCFQYALCLIGLAMSVPITFAFLLLAGAISSRLSLGEPITLRTLLALTTLIVAVCLLSLGAGEASQSILEDASPRTVLLGIVMAMVAGTGYGVGGVTIRRHVRDLPVSATLVLINTVGVVFVGGFGLLRLPTEVILSVTWFETGIMLLAGVFNAAAFYCIGVAFRYLNVTQVNMVNTSQIALAAVAGILFFQEPLTTWLAAGILLTIAGLCLMDRR